MTTLADRLWGCGDPDRLFGAHPRASAPWPRAPRRKHQPAVDLGAVAALVQSPVALRDVDPRGLWSGQPWVLREHVSYYRTGRWERTGETSADRFSELNQYPVVFDDHRGRPVIVAGHHRATAALLAGRPLTVRVPATDGRSAITPLLWFDPKGPATSPWRSSGLARRRSVGTTSPRSTALPTCSGGSVSASSRPMASRRAPSSAAGG